MKKVFFKDLTDQQLKEMKSKDFIKSGINIFESPDSKSNKKMIELMDQGYIGQYKNKYQVWLRK
jgi:hypothetical protein